MIVDCSVTADRSSNGRQNRTCRVRKQVAKLFLGYPLCAKCCVAIWLGVIWGRRWPSCFWKARRHLGTKGRKMLKFVCASSGLCDPDHSWPEGAQDRPKSGREDAQDRCASLGGNAWPVGMVVFGCQIASAGDGRKGAHRPSTYRVDPEGAKNGS